MDDGGECWNVIIGAVVGAVVGGVVAGVTSYKETGKVDVVSVIINSVVGAASGAIAATGLGAIAQAGLTAAVTMVGNTAEQIHTNKGFKNFNYFDVCVSGSFGFVTSLLGSGVGKLVAGKLNNQGLALLKKGQEKLLNGLMCEWVCKTHPSFILQGYKYVSQGIFKINTYRGITSVIGTGIGAITTDTYNMMSRKLWE